ncbi:MAG: hypothetical protein QOH56_2191 [Pseudonocardiales bacterium]|nr:hypothetical protein [Pseudonocardiales bacterium]
MDAQRPSTSRRPTSTSDSSTAIPVNAKPDAKPSVAESRSRLGIHGWPDRRASPCTGMVAMTATAR